MTSNQPNPSNLPTEIRRRINQIANAFEDGWSMPSIPIIKTSLDSIEEEYRRDLLMALIEVDVELRGRAGHTVSIHDYQDFEEIDAEFLQIVIDESDQAVLGQTTARATSKKEPVLPNDTVPGCKLLQLIGVGGMGAVWMADQIEPIRRRVAVKLVRDDKDTKETITRFEAERQALAMMDHQNICKVLDAGTTEKGKPYFVMELVKGVPINQYCDNNKLSVNARLKLFSAVCNALQHAHQKGIIHRDLKPSNILVTMYDGNPVPKVIDFGLAKALDHTSRLTDKTMFTEFGKIVGTLQYMSPEQADTNQLDIDTRTDIYSLGVMLYELLTGSTPLDQQTLGQKALLKVLELIKESDPPRPSMRLSSAGESLSGISDQRKIAPTKLQQILRGELDWVVMKALEKDRTRRYATAQSFGEDIERYLQNEPVLARPPSTVYKIRKFVSKNRGMVASVAAMLVLLIGGLAGTSYGLALAKEENTRANQLNETLQGNFDETRTLAFQLVNRAEQDLASNSKLAELRKWMTETAVKVFENVHEQRPNDPNVLSDLGQLYKFSANLSKFMGEFETAFVQYSKAIKNLKLALELDPDNKFANDRLAEAFRDYANQLKLRGKLKDASRVLEQAAKLIASMRQKFPDSSDIKRTEAINCVELADVETDRNNLDIALEASQRATQLLTELANSQAPGLIDDLLLVAALDDQSIILQELGRLEDAVNISTLADKRMALKKATMPKIPSVSLFEAKIKYRLAKAMDSVDKANPRIEPLLDTAITGITGLIDKFPNKWNYFRLRASLYLLKVSRALAAEQFEEAERFGQLAKEDSKLALENAGYDVSYRETYAKSVYSLYMINSQQGQNADAENIRKEADKEFKEAIAEYPENKRLIRYTEKLLFVDQAEPVDQ